jgi:hypothetical protein
MVVGISLPIFALRRNLYDCLKLVAKLNFICYNVVSKKLIKDYIMSRTKSNKLAPFQKLLTVMISGKPVTFEEIDTLLGKEIYMYRISTYMWHIKTFAGGVVKSIKDGRKVTAYQIINVKEVKEYMKTAGIDTQSFTPGQVQKKPSISKLADLKATPVTKKSAVKKVAKVKEDVVEPVSADVATAEVDVIEVTEVTA